MRLLINGLRVTQTMDGKKGVQTVFAKAYTLTTRQETARQPQCSPAA